MAALALAVVTVLLAPGVRAAKQDLLVADRGTNNKVLRYDGVTGAFLGEFVTAGSGGLEFPFGMTFGPDGNLYVSEGQRFSDGTPATEPRVIRYDGANGDFINPFTPVFPSPIRYIVFGPDGDLYGSTLGVVFRADGTTGEILHDAFCDVGLGEFGNGLAFGPDGNLYVGSFSGNEVVRCDGTTGDFIDVFAEIPLAGTDGNVGQVIFGPDGNLYVSLTNTGNDILRFDGSTGELLGSFIPAEDVHPDGPVGMVFGPDGNLYVTARDTDQVLRYDGTTGDFIDVFASGGGLDEPSGLVFFAPEPGQALLVATGALVLAGARKRRTLS
jgi:DNA-binding beta-propeller fold protein YncE